MEIINRAQAVALGYDRYFTGRPCRNGHIDYRYTTSGTCKSCIAADHRCKSATNLSVDPEVMASKTMLDDAIAKHAAAVKAAESRKQLEEQAFAELKRNRRIENEAVTATMKMRGAIRAELVKVQVRVFDCDRDALAAAAWAMGVMRYPVLTQGDVDPRQFPQGVAGGTALYAFYCHIDDVAQLKAIAGDMLKAHRPDIQAVRRAAFGVAADGAPVPDQRGEPWPGDPDYK